MLHSMDAFEGSPILKPYDLRKIRPPSVCFEISKLDLHFRQRFSCKMSRSHNGQFPSLLSGSSRLSLDRPRDQILSISLDERSSHRHHKASHYRGFSYQLSIGLARMWPVSWVCYCVSTRITERHGRAWAEICPLQPFLQYETHNGPILLFQLEIIRKISAKI